MVCRWANRALNLCCYEDPSNFPYCHDAVSSLLGEVLEVSENGNGTSGEVILFGQTPKSHLTNIMTKDG